MWTAILMQSAGPETLPPLVGLGVGGGIALVIFWFYVKREREIVLTLTKFTESFQATIERNATAMTELSASVRELMLVLRDYSHCEVEEGPRETRRLPARRLRASEGPE